MSRHHLRKEVQMLMFAVLATVLMFIAIPLFPYAPFLTLDISDLAIIAVFFFVGKKQAQQAILLSSLLYASFHAWQLAVLLGLVGHMLFSYLLLLTLERQRGLGSQLLLINAGLLLANFFFLLPAYEHLLNFYLPYSVSIYFLFALLPFNTLKIILLRLLMRELQRIPIFKNQNK